MAGGLFAIHKSFFNYLGQYDDEYEIWGKVRYSVPLENGAILIN